LNPLLGTNYLPKNFFRTDTGFSPNLCVIAWDFFMNFDNVVNILPKLDLG